MRRNDKILIVVILLAVGIMWAWMYGHRERGGYVVVSVDGEEYGKYSLEEEQMGEIGETNRLEITDGGAKMVHADCPDRAGMHPVSGTGDRGINRCDVSVL